MPLPTSKRLSDIRGAARLAADAGEGITDVVENLHRSVQLWRGPIGPATTGSTRGITGLVYRGVRGGIRLAGRGVDATLAGILPRLPPGESTPRREAFLSVLNGVYGDHLEATRNPLAIEMSLRIGGAEADPAAPLDAFGAEKRGTSASRILLLVHGLCMNDLQWNRGGHDHGRALAAELGFTPVYLRYNTGLSVTRNGRELGEQLEALFSGRAHPLDELVIIGHSMGGLVARSACHHAEARSHSWLSHLRKLVFLGTPHHGAPLERSGHLLTLAMACSPYAAPFARIGNTRSAGISDLRHGSITGRDEAPVPLPTGVRCYAAAASRAPAGGSPGNAWIGDGLVPVDSALGRHRDPRRTLAIPASRQWVGRGMGHLELLDRPDVHEQLREWLAEPNS